MQNTYQDLITDIQSKNPQISEKLEGGKKIVKIDPAVGMSHFYQYNGTTNTGHYTHICLPENWLIKE